MMNRILAFKFNILQNTCTKQLGADGKERLPNAPKNESQHAV